jgi:hypothetical protein
MYTEVFSLDSKTAHFNRAVDRVKKDPQCTELLGNSKQITAYGEPTWNKWARARPIAYGFSFGLLEVIRADSRTGLLSEKMLPAQNIS